MCNLRRAERCAYGKAAPENRIIRSVTRKVTDKVTEKVTDNLDEKLLVSRKTVSQRLKELKEKGIIERIGSDRKGYWKINNE